MKRVVLISLALLSSGCVSSGYWYRANDGKRVDLEPQLLQQFQLDKGYCDGEAAKARLSAGRNWSASMVNLVFNGCLNGKGYVVRP